MTALRWRGWLAAGMIFLLGLAVGGALTTVIGIRLFRQAMRAPAESRGAADRAAERIGADLTKSLQLTPEESVRVQTILNESAARLKGIRVRAAAQAVAEVRASTERIATELPPEKHADFYRVMARRYERLGLSPPPLRSP